MKKYPFWFLLLLGMGLSLSVSTRVRADDSRATAQLHWSKIHGRVVSVVPESKQLAVSDRDGNVTLVSVDKNVQILRYYRVVDFDELKLKDPVELRYIGS